MKATKGILVVALGLSAASATLWAQTTATGNEFADVEKKSGLTTKDFDRSCTKLFDSANPLSMAFELVEIFGPGMLVNHAPDLAALAPDVQARKMADLRALAVRKIWLPTKYENELGDQLHKRFVSDGRIIAPDQLNARDTRRLAQIQTLLDAVTGTLAKDSPYTFRLFVIDGNETNASMSVGGYLYVTLGLLRDRSLNDNDISLRLAHEVAHLTKRHSLKDIQLKMVDSIAVSKDVRGMLRFTTDPVGTAQRLLSTLSSTQILFQQFSQNQELEGDSCGMLVLATTPGVDANAALTNYVESRPTASTQAWDTSHPRNEDREAVMREQLERQRRIASGGPANDPARAAAPKEPKEPKEDKGVFSGLFGKIKDALPIGGNNKDDSASPDTPKQ
jgi:hypothetical protein